MTLVLVDRLLLTKIRLGCVRQSSLKHPKSGRPFGCKVPCYRTERRLTGILCSDDEEKGGKGEGGARDSDCLWNAAAEGHGEEKAAQAGNGEEGRFRVV